jgi:50S ribosomal protein L16 3-hydroxylase
VIRNAFQHFVDPLDQDELAGLAQEADVDARIVSQIKQKWSVNHGPFEDFTPYCVGDWTLLVQSVDKYSQSAKALLRAFDFIPSWRIDDLMVSFSICGAGVGPHVDQYDVFIVQGKGSRRWQVGANKQYQTSTPTTGLQQIVKFEPIIDEVLQPGDMIYIPPGFPHNGVAQEDCLNYSIGFRAPTQKELLNSLADYASEQGLFELRYSDPDLQLRNNRFELSTSEKDKFKHLCQQMLNSSHFEDFLGYFLSDNSTNQCHDIEFTENYLAKDIADMLASGVQFQLELNAKIVQHKIKLNNEYQYVTWVNQHKIITDQLFFDDFQTMINSPFIDKTHDIYHKNISDFCQTLTTLVNAGAWYPVSEHT